MMPRNNLLRLSRPLDPEWAPRPARARLRAIPGGVDLEAPPIHITPVAGETATSWLRRAAWRYQISPQDVLRTGGTVRTVVSTSAAAHRLRAGAGFTARLGLSPQEQAVLEGPTALEAATARWAEAYHRTFATPASLSSRFCPRCLAGPEPYWHKDWSSPLLTACPEHATMLVSVCPGCGRAPHTTRAWLSHPIPIWQCPGRLVTAPPGRGRARPWCATDLRTVEAEPAPAQALRTQRVLMEWARAPHAVIVLAGVTVTGQIAFDAVMELSRASRPTNLGGTAAGGGVLDQAVAALTAPSPGEARARLARLMPPSSRLAPVHLTEATAQEPRNPLLAAVQLEAYGPHLSAGTQLTLRLGAAHGRYPHGATTTGTRRTQMLLPEHQQARRLPRGLIPQAIWPGALPALDDTDPIEVAAGSLLLARTGSTTHWTDLARYLGLPDQAANQLTWRLRAWRADGAWPRLLTQVEALHAQVCAHRPPIGYRTRRTAATDTDLLTTVLQEAAGGTAPAIEVQARFYERLTGSHAAWHPGPYAHPGQQAGWHRLRTRIDQDQADLFETAFALLRHRCLAVGGRDLGGPLTWAPPPASCWDQPRPCGDEEQ